MSKKSERGTGLFMMEMIMVVFFFILCASTCILVFSKANNMSRLAKDTNDGVVAAESVAEVWKAEGLQGLQDRFSAVSDSADPSETEQGSCRIFWNSDWSVAVSDQEAVYITEVVWKTTDDVSEAEVKITRTEDSENLYSLLVKKYLGSRD